MKKIIILILPLLILFSCSVQKRKYQKGFYVSQSNHTKQTQKENHFIAKKERNSDLLNETISIYASALPGNPTILKINETVFTNDSLCDMITLQNGDEVSAKVLEISATEVKYKKCSAFDGPLYIVKKTDVFMIKYADGKKEIFTTEASKETNNTSSKEPLPDTSYNGPKTMHPKAKSALIFAWFGIIPLLGIFACIKAIVDASDAKKDIKQNPNQYTGETRANTAKKIAFAFLLINFGALFILRLILAA